MTQSRLHLDRLRLRHFRLLDLIDQHGSLRAVGNVINLTQPAVSQMVKDLEYALGVTLVERSVRGVTLNAAGQLALQRTKSGLATFEHMARELQADLSPVMRIGVNPVLMSQLLPSALLRLNVGQTDMRFKLRTGTVGDMMRLLWNGELDCYVGHVDWDLVPTQMASVLRHDALIQTELAIACSVTHPLAKRTQLSVQDLVDCRWALASAESNIRMALEAGLRNHGLSSPVASVEIEADPKVLINLAKQVNLLTCVPSIALETHTGADEICVLDLPDLNLPLIQIDFVTLAEHEDMDSLQAVRHALTEAAGDYYMR